MESDGADRCVEGQPVEPDPGRARRECAAASVGADVGEYDYYPTEWISPYLERRRKIGWDLYGLLGIGKHRQGQACTRSMVATTASSTRRSG